MEKECETDKQLISNCHTSWRKYFTLIWWKLQMHAFLNGQPPLNITATYTIEIPDPPESTKPPEKIRHIVATCE